MKRDEALHELMHHFLINGVLEWKEKHVSWIVESKHGIFLNLQTNYRYFFCQQVFPLIIEKTMIRM